MTRLLDSDAGLSDPMSGTPNGRIRAARDHCLFEWLYGSGLRLAEVVSLDLGALDPAACQVRVTGKRNKTRLVPVGRKAAEALGQWLTLRRHWARPDEPAVFINDRGQRLTPRSVQLRLNRLSRQAGLDAPFTRTSSGMPLPPTCWNPPATCARCRRCSAMRASRPPRFTPISISNT